MQETEVHKQQIMEQKDQRLIESGFPCHQVGAETQRERGASSALPPLYFLHVWWARRPLAPSRAAVLASLLPAETDSEKFLKELGIRLLVANVDGADWILNEEKLKNRVFYEQGQMWLRVDGVVRRALLKEETARQEQRDIINKITSVNAQYENHTAILKWQYLAQSLPSIPEEGTSLSVRTTMGDPAWFKTLMEIGKSTGIRIPNLYGYDRAYKENPPISNNPKVIFDPTAGGGSIPFEALRLGHQVIANELNPVASVILKGTCDYPFQYGEGLIKDIQKWGEWIEKRVDHALEPYFPSCQNKPTQNHNTAYRDQTYLFCRQVSCPHCNSDAPLLNSLWLSKVDGDNWGISINPLSDGTVQFKPFKVTSGTKKQTVQDLNKGTIANAVGQCVHCHQAIDDEEIKRQARGESAHGQWQNTLYCVVGIRLEPKFDKQGEVQHYTSGPRKGEIKTKKMRYFRAPNEQDLQALRDAEDELERRRVDFEMKGLIPNEPFPKGNDMRPVIYGMPTWADMFIPRQLLGHLITMEALQVAKPQILEELGHERGRAVVTYLQFMIDKIVDYNSCQTRWIPQRTQLSGTFGRHDFSLKWTFGEMVYSGPSSGLKWGVSQVIDAYTGLCELAYERAKHGFNSEDIQVISTSATDLSSIEDDSIDLVVMDPPYYNNVQYNELSDFYYVWQKSTFYDLYPGWFNYNVTDKAEEAVANPARDGSMKDAQNRYEELIQSIFAECKRVLKPNGLMTLMFTHKSKDAWETFTNSLINSGWDITATYPVESEFGSSQHQLDLAAAASSLFLSCRPANRSNKPPSSWSYDVKAPLEDAVRDGLYEFEKLDLNPVDRMIASWGRALRIYSRHWPVVDGNEEVSPTRAMQEAARVVAEEEVSRISGGKISVDKLDSESRLAVIALGINGLGSFAFDDALQMSKSLNLALQHRTGNYRASPDMVAYNNENDPAKAAPLAKKGSKLRLLAPSDRDRRRVENPQTLWDILQGLIMQYREGGIVPARNYLGTLGMEQDEALHGLLQVWADECGNEELQREARLLLYEL